MTLGCVVVLAKEPVPGRVKTRLVPPLAHADAARLARAALTDTLETLADAPAEHHLLALEGEAGDWLSGGWRVVPQVGGGLDRRIAGALAAVPCGPAVLVGMDTPQLSIDMLTAFDAARFDACLGPTDDGGYWVIGLRDPRRAPEVILGVPMSTSQTGEAQWRRLRKAGMRVQLLPTLMDVDTIVDAEHVAAIAPHTRFADAFRTLLVSSG
jgi:glycosyltransferase A (GT-A) superfamily protein (DUF2064 family)